jgi:hypothetical protein
MYFWNTELRGKQINFLMESTCTHLKKDDQIFVTGRSLNNDYLFQSSDKHKTIYQFKKIAPVLIHSLSEIETS